MSDVVMQLAGVMSAETRSLDTLAHNAANLATPGFRSFHSALDAKALSAALSGRGAASAPIALSAGDGPLKVTGRKTDLALRGAGWFLVDTPDGLLLTRDGRFLLGADGILADRAGRPIDAGGAALGGLDADFSVLADGTVHAHGKQIGRLRIVEVKAGGEVVPAGDGLYRFNGEIEDATGVAVVQGAYEESNVRAAADMLQLMRTVRHVESIQRAISAYESAIGTGINQIGN